MTQKSKKFQSDKEVFITSISNYSGDQLFIAFLATCSPLTWTGTLILNQLLALLFLMLVVAFSLQNSLWTLINVAFHGIEYCFYSFFSFESLLYISRFSRKGKKLTVMLSFVMSQLVFSHVPTDVRQFLSVLLYTYFHCCLPNELSSLAHRLQDIKPATRVTTRSQSYTLEVARCKYYSNN